MNIDQFEKFITRGMAAQAAVDKITGRQPDELARLHAINAELVGALDSAIGDLGWMSGSADFSEDGKAHKGWLGVRARMHEYRAVLAKAKEQT